MEEEEDCEKVQYGGHVHQGLVYGGLVYQSLVHQSLVYRGLVESLGHFLLQSLGHPAT